MSCRLVFVCSVTLFASVSVVRADPNACVNACYDRFRSCVEAAARSGKSAAQSMKDAQTACQPTALACVESCTASGAGGAYSNRGNRGSTVTDDDFVDLNANAETTRSQLVSDWHQRDSARLAEAKQTVAQLTAAILHTLCQSTPNGGCTTGSKAAPNLVAPRVVATRPTSDRWKQQAASVALLTGAATSGTSCAPSPPPPPPSSGRRESDFYNPWLSICLPGADCNGSSSQTIHSVTFTATATVLPASGMCILPEQSVNFQWTLTARNDNPQAVIVEQLSGSLTTDRMPGNAANNNIPPAQKIEPGQSSDFTFVSDCGAGQAIAATGKVSIREWKANTGVSLTVNVGNGRCSNQGQGTKEPSRPAFTLTAPAEVVTPTYGGTLTVIE